MTRHSCHAQYHATRSLRYAYVCALGILVSPTAHAQASADSATSSWVTGGSLGLLAAGRDRIPTIGVQWTQVRAEHLGLDFSVGTSPLAIAVGALAVAGRGGLTLPIVPRAGVMLLPSAGLSLLAAASGEGGGAAYGYNVGGAAILGTGTTRFRGGITWHRMRDENRGYWLIEMGIANTPASSFPATPST